MIYAKLSRLKISFSPTLIPGAILLLYGIAALGYLTAISWSAPVLDMFGFRQAQTALSVYWMEKGGALLAYQTPVAGYPWSIPFEFPIYQWLVALFGSLTGFSVDQSGRVIGIILFLGAAVVVYKIIVKLTTDRGLSLACTGTFLASPIAIFWARSVMIESTVLFFSLAFIYGIIQYYLTYRKRYVFWSVLFAVCAALVKITTFYNFAIFLAVGLIVVFWRELVAAKSAQVFWTSEFIRIVRTIVLAALAVAISLVLLIVWVRYSDSLKEQTVIGGKLTSSAISNFNFGTLKQRLDIGSWDSIIFGRAIHQILGSRWILLGAMGILAFNARFRWIGLLLLAIYLVPFLTFTNLYYVHSYYQFENFAFLTTLVGLAISALARQGPAGVFMAIVSAIAVALVSLHVVRVDFAPTISMDWGQNRTIELARFVRGHTNGNSALLIFGLDWSSEVPYYATRKAVAVPDWLPANDLRLLLNQDKLFGANKLGALIVCPNSFSTSKAPKRSVYDAIIKKYSLGRKVQIVSNCQVFFDNSAISALSE